LRTVVSGLAYTPVSDLGIGSFSVQVRSRSASGAYSAWSDFRNFQIKTPPVAGAVESVTRTGRPIFTWSNLPGAVQFLVKLRNRTTGQENSVIVDRMDNNSYQFPNSLGLGQYELYIRGIDASGIRGDWSSVKTFLSLEAVNLVSPSSSLFSSFPTLTWSPVLGATVYELLLKNRRTGATVAAVPSISSTTWTPSTALPVGDYSWSVRARIGTVLVGSWSATRDFNNGGRPILLTSSGTTTDRTPSIEWAGIQGAASYSVWFVRVDTKAVVVRGDNLTGTSFTPPTDLAPGQYRVWLRAISTTGTSSVSDSFITITITNLDETDRDEFYSFNTTVPVLIADGLSHLRTENEPFEVVSPEASVMSELPLPTPAEEVAAAPSASASIDVVMTEWAVGSL
jgi:hypothetical protein